MGFLERVHVKQGDDGFSKAVDLYNSAFPEEERFSPDEFDKLCALDTVRFSIYTDDGDFVAFDMSVDAGKFVYLVFFAVRDDMRSRGYGSRILDLMKSDGKPIILDIEPVDSDEPDTVRRASFYERNEFDFVGFSIVEDDGTRYSIMTDDVDAFDIEAFYRLLKCAMNNVYWFEIDVL